MIKLPENYTIIEESNTAVLAHNENKKEYVAWSKDINNGVCWGHYYSYYFTNDYTKEQAHTAARQRFLNK